MPVRDIRATIGVDGEKEFTAALSEAARSMKLMDGEVKKAAAAYELSGDKAEYLAEKSRLLDQEIKQQEKIVEALSGALSDAESKYGSGSKKVDQYRAKLNTAETQMLKLKKASQDTDQEMEELGRDAGRVGRQLEQGLGEAAEEVSDKVERMARQVEKDLSDIGGAVEFSAFMDAGEAVTGAFETLQSFTEGTEDYRRQMSFLLQNTIDAGFEFAYIKERLFEVASLTGDLDGAFEGISNLLASGFDGRNLAEAIELIGGAVIKFPETMKFENLAESLQESVAAKNATGAYAELLERLGVDLETVNKSLEQAKTTEAAQQVALSYLNGHGLEETLRSYKEMNADLLEAEETQLRYNDALANLGEVLTPVATSWVNFKTDFVTGVKDIVDGGFDTWISGLNTELANLREELDNWVKKLIGEEAYEKLFGGEKEGGTAGEYAGMVQLGTEAGTAFGSAYGAAAQAEVNAALTKIDESSSQNSQVIGSNISTDVGNGIVESQGNATNAATNLWNSIRNILTQKITIPQPTFNAETYNGTGQTTASSYAAGGQNNTVTVVTTIDGNTVGKSTADSVSNVQGAQAQRASTYNR